MALLCANGMRTASGPNRMFSGVTTVAGGHRRENVAVPHTHLNFAAGWHSVSGVTNRSSVPQGARHPIAYKWPRKAGGLASFNGINGAATFAGAGALGVNGDLTIEGAGGIPSAALALVLSAVAALTGSGVLTAEVRGRLDAVAALAGAGDLEAALGAMAGLATEIEASGSASASAAARGSMSAEIVVTGEALSTANIGDAVWSALIEQGFTAAQVLRIVSAVVAGKASGGPGSPVFRDLGDTTDRVTGTADADGNRTAVSYSAGDP